MIGNVETLKENQTGKATLVPWGAQAKAMAPWGGGRQGPLYYYSSARVVCMLELRHQVALSPVEDEVTR